MTETFEWENIEDYESVTGIVPIDKALVYADPVGPLKEHLARRERDEGRERVIADLGAILEATPVDSPAHEGAARWLRRYQAGASAEDL